MTSVDELLMVDDGAPLARAWNGGGGSGSALPPAPVGVLLDLYERGYTTEFDIHDDGLLCCRVCGVCVPAEAPHIDSLHLVDVPGRRGRSIAVVAVTCVACSCRGVALVRRD